MNQLDFKNRVDKHYIQHRLKGTPLESEGTSNMEDLYFLLEEKDPSLLEEIEEMFGFAGKTSVNVFEAKGFPKEYLDERAFLEKLRLYIESTTPGLLHGRSIPFGKQLRPDLENVVVPVINLVKERDDGYLIQFVSGIPYQINDSWEVRTVLRPSFETVIVRLSYPAFVEIRSGFKQAGNYLTLMQSILGLQASDITWIPLTKVSESEAERIAQLLDAGLVEADHVGSGIYAMKRVAAAEDVPDLRQEPEYKTEFQGQQYLSQTLKVKYNDNTGYSCTVSFKVQMSGGFHFLSKVSESIITSVMEAFVQARYLDKVAELAPTQESLDVDN